MRTMMTVLAAVVLFTSACGGTDYSHPAPTYSLAGHWQLWTGSAPADAAVIGTMDLPGDLSGGTYADSAGAQALTGHAFATSSPEFSLTFGSRTVTGTLLAESNSNVFKGTVGIQAVTGVWAGEAH